MEAAAQRESIIRFGVFEVDLRAHELHRQGMKVKLQDQPFQVLALLLEHPGEVVTREDLRKRLWPVDTFVDFDHSLSTAINKIREALGDSAESSRYVETVPRRGYRFIAAPPPPGPPLRYTPSGIVRKILPNVVAAAIESHQAKKRWQLAAVLIAILALAASAILLVRLRVIN
jgi:DNA-binding winged helix-turn-helix (wHTH) protein